MKGLKEQMTKKYIVKNCPARKTTKGFCGDDRPEVFCSDCTDCLIKQVVEKCREEENWVNCSDNKPTETAEFAQQILQLFTIEEVE